MADSDQNNLTARPTEARGSASVSVLVLAKDEEANIKSCLECLSFSDDVVLLDSYSTDCTVDLAEQFPNVRVVRRKFDTEYKQRNYGLHDIAYRHPWLYICDADERVPTDLAQEILDKATACDDGHAAYRLRYKNMFMGRWIKHATSYPIWLIRLVRPERVRYEVRQTNVHPIVDGPVGELSGHFVHYSFNSGLCRWFAKHNFYSHKEAMEGVTVRAVGPPPLGKLVTSDPMSRRRAAKNTSYFLKGRGFWRFLYQYFFHLGFLDGAAGFRYCTLVSMYEYWIEVKIREQEQGWSGRTKEVVGRLLQEPGS